MNLRTLVSAALACLLAATGAHGQTNLVTLDPNNTTDPLNNAWFGGEWNTNGDLGGWSASNITGATVAGGVLSGTASSTAAVISLTGITVGPDFDLGYNDYLDVRLKLPANYTGNVQIYYGVVNGGYADGDPGPRNLTGFDASRCFTIPNASLAMDGAFHVYRVNLSLEVWCRGQLNDLRLVPATVSGTAFEIDYIRIGDTGPVPTVNGYNSTDAPFSLQSKNFIFGWNDAAINAVGMNSAWAKLNLRNAEEVWAHHVHKLNYPKPRGHEVGAPYKINYYCVYGGNFSDCWTFLNVGYYELRTDPPTWTMTHELTHAFQGRLSSGNVPGEYYELHANYGREQWLKHYQALFPNQSGFAPSILGEMHMSQPIGRNYYETWQPYLYLDTNPDNLPDVGVGTSGSSYASWREMAAGETSIFQSLKHSLTNTNVKDLIGYYARRGLNYNYPGYGPIKAKIGAIKDWEQLTEPIRRPDAPDWWQVPHQRAPMQAAFTIHELTPAGTGASRVVSVDLRGLLAEGTGDNWRASLIVMNDSGGERYSALFGNNQTGSVTLAANENKVYLVVAATPDDYAMYRFDESQFPYRSDLQKRRFHYEFRVTGATPRERDNGATSGLVQHANGGGWKAGTANVASTAFIGPNARVLNTAQVLGSARVEDFAVVSGNARVQDNAIVRGHAQVYDNAVMSGNAMVADFARLAGSGVLSGSARLLEHATLSGGSVTDQSVMKGSSGSWGGTLSGNSIADGDYGFGRDIHNASISGHLPWVGIPDNWLVPLPTGLYASYEFSAASDAVALDTHAATNGILRGTPNWLSVDGTRTGILQLNGTDQWVQLERSVADMQSLSLTTWVKWNGGAANQTLFQFGDGGSKSVTFTPSNGSGVAELRASDGSNTYSIASASALPVGTWCQVAVSLDGTTGKFTINGSAAGSGSLRLRPYQFLPPNTAANPAHNFIGRSTAGNFLNGSLDDFKVFSVASPSFLLVSAEAPETTVPENAPNVTFRISRASLNGSSASGNLSVNYTVSGTTTAGADYVAPSGSVVIPDGQAFVDLEIPLILDEVTEPNETLILNLTASNNYANAGSGSATITIPDVGDISASVLAWYKFDETSGTTANDSSGNNKHADLVNGPVWNTGEKALSFDDANDDNDYVQTPVPNGSTRTLSAWFRPRSSTWIQNIWNYNAVFDSDVPGAYGAGWGVVDNKIRVMLDDQMWDTGISVTLNQWQHGSLTFDSTRVRFYLNGVLQGSFSYSQGDITTANYTIGSKAFDGQIRDAKILNRTVYSAEAMQIYQAGAPQRAPLNLTAVAGHGSITLGWQPANSGEAGYIVRRATTTGGPYTDIATVTSTSFVDASVTNGTTYYYVVAGVILNSPGPDSNEASTTPAAGSALPPPWQHGNFGTAAGSPTTSFSGGQVTVSGAGASIPSNNATDSFRFVYIPVVGDCTITARLVSQTGTNSARRAGVMIRESLAANARHASTLITPATSNNRTFVRRTTAGNNATATSVTNTNTWVRIVRASNTFTSFTSADGSNWTPITTSSAVSMTGFAAPYYVGLAVCSGNATTLSTAVFSNVSITGGYPTGLSATAGNAQVSLTWNAVSDPVSGATSYRVKRATSAGGPYALLSSPTTNSFIDTTAANDTTYYYVVSAHNGTSESANSAEVFATPSAPLPSVPLGLLASDQGTSVQLSWSASSNAAGYRVKRALSPKGPFTLIGSPAGTSFTDNAATPGVNFFYVVAAANASNLESGDSDMASIVRALHFDPNGPAVGSVVDGGTYSWLASHWAIALGGTLGSGSWQTGKQALFAATYPGPPLAYNVDLAGYDTGTHGNFTGIRALAGTVTLTGNVSNFYLTTPITVTADPGAAILFQQTRAGANVLAFNLNSQPATFHGDITVNSAGIGNNGSVIVGSGHLKLGNAIANFSPASTVLQAGTTLTNIGDAGKSFNLGALTMNGSTLAATNAGHASFGNYTFSGSLNVGGAGASLISADIRCGNNATHTLHIGETGENVDLFISGRLGHYNGLSWGYANKTGPGTLKLSGTNNLGGMTVSEGTVILEGSAAIASMDVSSLTNNNASVILSVPTGTVSYPRALQGNGLYTKTGSGVLELTTTTVHGGNHRVQEGILRMTQPRFGDASSITIDSGAQIDLAFTGRDTIRALVVNGVTLPPGIYSASTHPAYLTGTGSLKVAASVILAWNNSAGTGIWNGSDANWTSQSWENLADALISHTNTAQIITLNGSLNAVDVHIGNGSNNARYTLLGAPGANLSALGLNVQGASANDPGLGAATLSNLNAQITSDLHVGRWDLVIGGSSTVNIAGQLRSTSDGSGAGDWGRVTLQDTANVTATGGVNGAGSAWGLTLNGGTLTTPSIRAAENTYSAGARLTLNGTTMVATHDTTAFLTVDGTNQAYVGSNGARFDTNGRNISVGVRLLNVSGQAGTLTKLGGGTVTLTNVANSFTGGTTINRGTLSVSAIADSGTSNIGPAGNLAFGGGTLNFTGASGSTARTLTFNGPGIIHVATGSSLTLVNGGWTGNGGFTKTGAGAMSVGANGGDRFTIDSTRGGGFNMTAGNFTVTGPAYFVLGDVGNATYNQNDGTFTLSASSGGYIGNGNGSNSTMNLTGGSFTQTADRMRIGQAVNSVGRMNIGSGASLATVTIPTINFSENSSGARGFLNLSTNGLLHVGKISKGAGAGTITFDGGTLRAANSGTDFMQGLTAATINAGGATIDTDGKNIAIGQALSAPTGSGVTSIAVTDSGSGYLCAPIVSIAGGTSSVPATAVANMVDDGTGSGTFRIGSLTITSPGVYTAPPTTVTLIGGGPATPATFGTPVLATHSSGTLTKNGLGTLTLTAASTYAGGTIVNAGTLTASGSTATLGSGNLTVASGATCAIANPNGAVANTATVYLTGTAKLDLASGVNETARFLHLNGVLQPAGTYTAANLPAHISGSGSLIVTEGAVLLTPAETWRDAHFGTTANTGNAADGADPDGDGSNNLLERALGTNPQAFDTSGKPAIDAGSSGFSFTFTRSRAATDLELIVEVSTDLQSSTWNEAVLAPAANADGALSTIDDTHPDVQVQRFTATTSDSRKFYRIRVLQ